MEGCSFHNFWLIILLGVTHKLKCRQRWLQHFFSETLTDKKIDFHELEQRIKVLVSLKLYSTIKNVVVLRPR